MPHICIIIARFYEDIAEELLRGAVSVLDEAAATYDVIPVPGAFEIPSALRMAIESGRYQGFITLGCVIRGETTHYDYVCAESARGINELAMYYAAPIGYGILTVESPEQAWARASLEGGNKGAWTAQACLRMLAVKTELGSPK